MNMTAAEFRVLREYLGVSGPWLARHLEVSDRTIRHWESGRYTVPAGVAQQLVEIEHDAAQAVADGLAACTDNAVVVTFACDDDFWTAHPGAVYPASWHRAVVARIREARPELAVEFAARQAE